MGGLARRAWPGFGPLGAPFGRPFSLARRLMDDLDRMFEELMPDVRWGGRELAWPVEREALWSPSVDVFAREGNLVVRADLPGLGKDDVRVEVSDGALTIEGERREEREEERSGVYHAERYLGAFRRVIPLPEDADPDTAEARFENGVLEITMKLSEERGRGRRIEIQEGKRTDVH